MISQRSRALQLSSSARIRTHMPPCSSTKPTTTIINRSLLEHHHSVQYLYEFNTRHQHKKAPQKTHPEQKPTTPPNETCPMPSPYLSISLVTASSSSSPPPCFLPFLEAPPPPPPLRPPALRPKTAAPFTRVANKDLG